ncbi:MAG: hypothetical protein WDO14_21585 [Bacteroidota bacterium]
MMLKVYFIIAFLIITIILLLATMVKVIAVMNYLNPVKRNNRGGKNSGNRLIQPYPSKKSRTLIPVTTSMAFVNSTTTCLRGGRDCFTQLLFGVLFI